VIGQAKIIDDLLDLSRVRTGKLALNLTMVDISAMLATIADAVEADAASRGIALSFEGIDKPVWTRVDPVRFDQIVWNLLSNALKFTPRGGAVAVRLTRDNGEVRIDVTDTGQGIEAAMLPHVFDMFSQGLDTRRKTGGGMGIGLALVKQLAEMHAGRVLARSEGAGRGSTMSVFLAAAADRSGSVGGDAERDAALRGLRLLIIDDDQETASALAALLELEGLDVVTAHGSDEAFDVLERELVDLLVCDISMPGAENRALIERLQADARLARIPTIALTDYSGAAGDPNVRAPGFDVYLNKPISMDSLAVAAEQVLGMRGSGGR
jgi:two-component system CheB/CheR fusion protein